MELNETVNHETILYVLSNAIHSFITESKKVSSAFFAVDNTVYKVTFTVIEQTTFNPEVMNDSHDFLIATLIDKFITAMNFKNVLEIRYNFDPKVYTARVQIRLETMPKQEFLKIERTENINKRSKERLYDIIKSTPKINLAQLTQVSRFIIDSNQRVKFLNELEAEGLIKSELIKTNKRNRKIYYVI